MRKKIPINRERKLAQEPPAPEETVALAFYPGKQAWKSRPGNRYAPEELQAMDCNWDIQLTNPDVADRRSAD